MIRTRVIKYADKYMVQRESMVPGKWLNVAKRGEIWAHDNDAIHAAQSLAEGEKIIWESGA